VHETVALSQPEESDLPRHSLRFHIVRGALVGFAGGLALGFALIIMMGSPASADSASWTLVTATPAGESCVIAVGEHWLDDKSHVPAGPQV